jgi:hypothetical protein
MKPDRMQEALARLDGRYTKIDALDGRLKVFDRKMGIPTTINYLHPTEGHGHLQRIIDGLDRKELASYRFELARIMKLTPATHDRIHLATVEQKAEAILRTKGEWTDD